MVKTSESKVPQLKFKVVSYVKYLAKARELLEKGPVMGMTEKWDIAISLLFDENEVIYTVQKAGETRFVCKA